MSDQDLELRRALQAIDDETRQRYGRRFAVHGPSPKALGWGAAADQEVRFSVILESLSLQGRHVLDYGCGFGDFYGYARDRNSGLARYTGVDLSSHFVTLAARRYPEATFAVNRSIEEDESSYSADVLLLIGLFNFRQSILDNTTYVRAMMKRAFSWTREVLVCDFLSLVPTPGYNQEDWVYYYDPADVLGWGLELSPRVRLRHDYRPNPQREMMLFVWR